jgi:hypothetical protein
VWLVKQLGFDYEIEFKKGKENVVVDSLSRDFCGELSTLVVSTISTIFMEEIKRSYVTDVVIQTLI